MKKTSQNVTLYTPIVSQKQVRPATESYRPVDCVSENRGEGASVDRELGDVADRNQLAQFERQHAIFELGFARGHVDVLR